MKSILISSITFLTLLIGLNMAKADQYLVQSEEYEKKVKVFSLVSNKMDYINPEESREVINFLISVSASFKNKRVYASDSSESGLDGRFLSIPLSREVSVTRGQYLNLLDLASRLPNDWDEVVYEKSEDCSRPQYIKTISFNGNSQTIISSCQIRPNSIPQITPKMKSLIALLEYHNNK